VGRSVGAFLPRTEASHASTRSSHRFRFCSRRVPTTVSSRSTNCSQRSEACPKLLLRQDRGPQRPLGGVVGRLPVGGAGVLPDGP
jgi:hypothetical protein